MKESKYNLIYNIKDKRYLFNTKSGALAEINNDFLAALDSIKNNRFNPSEFDPELIENMKYAEAIIDDDRDELGELEYLYLRTKLDSCKLSLVILTTLDCNCRCKYCYESRKKGKLSAQNQNLILDFIKEHKPSTGLKITWFGGEPLLDKATIYNLSSRLVKFCAENGIEYKSSMITNLTLFDESDIEKFKQYNISQVQVTLDGPEKIHNLRRPELNCKNSYSKIIRNINLLLSNGIEVDIRINIDRENEGYIDDLLDELEAKLPKTKLLCIYPAPVCSSTEACKDVESSCIRDEDWSNFESLFYKKAIQKNLSINVKKYVLPYVRAVSCGAEINNYFVIDPQGNMYKCLMYVGDENRRFGTLDSNLNSISKHNLPWLIQSPFESSKCRNCKILPLCFGGCRHKAITENKLKPVCEINEINLKNKIEAFLSC